MKNKFFEILKAKLQKNPDRLFDQQFWSKFENEFGSKKEVHLPFWRQRWIQSTALGSLAIVAVFATKSYYDNAPVPQDMTQSFAIMAQRELFEDFDMFLTIENVELSDEDWDFLLKEDNEKNS